MRDDDGTSAGICHAALENSRPGICLGRRKTFRKDRHAGLFTFLLIVQTLVAVALITLILMQRSEGGGLAGGGSPAGMMSARGASDFLTRGTAILADRLRRPVDPARRLAAGQRGPRTIDAASAPARPPAPAAPAPASAAPARRSPAAQPAPPAQPPAAAATRPARRCAQ